MNEQKADSELFLRCRCSVEPFCLDVQQQPEKPVREIIQRHLYMLPVYHTLPVYRYLFTIRSLFTIIV